MLGEQQATTSDEVGEEQHLTQEDICSDSNSVGLIEFDTEMNFSSSFSNLFDARDFSILKNILLDDYNNQCSNSNDVSDVLISTQGSNEVIFDQKMFQTLPQLTSYLASQNPLKRKYSWDVDSRAVDLSKRNFMS